MTRPIRLAHVTTVDSTLRFLLLDQLRRLRDKGFQVETISAAGPWVPELEAEGIRHIEWPHATRSWDPWSDAKAFIELVRILRRERFDLVHTHNPKPGILGRVAAWIAGVPCVVNTVHGLYANQDDPWVRRAVVLALERLAGWFSDAELYQSEEDRAWARKTRLVPPEKAVLLGNGVDLSLFDPEAVPSERVLALRRELGLDSALVVGTVARLVREKGYRELFAAAETVRAMYPEVRFIAIGDQDRDKADAITDAEIERARKHLTFVGWRTDVRDFLALVDVFVLPSWREGVPRSAIEAAAMGKPLILTNIRGCREVARDGVEGILVPPRDPDSLAAGIELLVRSPNLRKRFGAAARARAVERFDEQRVAATVNAVYRKLLSRKGLLQAEDAGRRPSTANALGDLPQGQDGIQPRPTTVGEQEV